MLGSTRSDWIVWGSFTAFMVLVVVFGLRASRAWEDRVPIIVVGTVWFAITVYRFWVRYLYARRVDKQRQEEITAKHKINTGA